MKTLSYFLNYSFSISSQKILNFQEIIKNEIIFLHNENVLSMKGVSLLYNTRNEIRYCVMEALNSKKIEYNSLKVKNFENKFETINKKYNLNIKGKFSKQFMTKYFDILF